MATIDGKSIMDFLIGGMDNPLPGWFKPFGHDPVVGLEKNVAYDAQFGSAGQDANWSHDVIHLVKWTNEGSKEVPYSIDLNLEGLEQL